LKLSGDPFETNGQMAGDVFEEHEGRPAFINDSGDLGPEVAWIVFPCFFPGNAEPLARVTRSNAIHRFTPRLAIKGPYVIPDRCFRYVALFHALCENGSTVCIPFDSTNNSCSGQRKRNTEIETSESAEQ
jgi:hypothetical protein